ncbi:hypothetical protein GQ53DRAFT_830784 [Thozetella sp. PMI_491]|nr:hypothetical protein GQ53DRAFT_830784 [Thozetella sp. PMI_491]
MFIPRYVLDALALLPSSLIARFPQGYPASTWAPAPPATTQWGNGGGGSYYTPPPPAPPVSTWAPAPAPAPHTTWAPSPTTWAAPPAGQQPPGYPQASPGPGPGGGPDNWPGGPAPPGIVVGGPVTVPLSPDKTVIVENPQVTVPAHGNPADWTAVPEGWYAQTYYTCVMTGCTWHEVMRPYAWGAGGRTEPRMLAVTLAVALGIGIVWAGI